MVNFKNILLKIGVVSSASITVTSVVSCAAEAPKENGTSRSLEHQTKIQFNTAKGPSSGFGEDLILDTKSYNDLYDEMIKTKNTVAIAVIANGNVQSDIVKVDKNETVMQALDSSKFIFKRYMHESMGAFINSYALRSKPNVFMHGTNTDKNYGDWYPMYYINHKLSQLGVSNFHLAGHEMLEFTFDKFK